MDIEIGGDTFTKKPNILEEIAYRDTWGKGIDIAPKYIPAEVFDKRAVEKNQVVFHDVAFIEVKPHVKGKTVAVELTDFSVFYSQDSIAYAEETLKNKGSKIVVEKGQIVKVSKDKDGIVTREQLTPATGPTGSITGRSISTTRASARSSAFAPKVLRRTSPVRILTENGKSSGPAITSSRTNGSRSAPRRTALWSWSASATNARPVGARSR